jgi:5S rRNA maturation endonuclease (ribonuclease M5)
MTATSHTHRRSIDEILTAYGIQRPNFDANGSGYTTCPQCSAQRKAANQRKLVLGVTIKSDGVVWYCNHCSWSGGEFFEPRPGMARIAATYDYRDEAGTLLFQAVRFFPKDFRQRRPDGKGCWIWDLKRVRRVLYRLPELLEAIKIGCTIVWIVEGEKDVEKLRALNEVATCNAMGAGKWRDEYAETLRGFKIAVVIADKDDAGRTHAQQVAASISKVVPTVKVIELPVKDVSDFLAADGTIDELCKIVKAAPKWTPGDSTGANGQWAEPDLAVLRLHRRSAVSFPIEILGDKWASWVKKAAHSAAAPVDYVASALLCSASALIGHARWARAWEGWDEPPHLWGCNVGDSGDGKSPGADTVHKHIVPEIEYRMARDFPDQLREAQKNIEIAKARQDNWKTDVKAAIKSGKTPPSPPSDVPEEPLAPRLMMDDVTIEKIALVLAHAAPKGVLMHRDEIAGWLLGMNAYNDAARGFWLEAHGGRRKIVDRVKHPVSIVVRRLAVSWHGGIQPERLAEVMRESDDGLLARFIWFWPEPIPFHRPKEPSDIEWAIMCFDRLRVLELANGEDGPQPLMVALDEAAAQRLERFGQLMQEGKEMAAGLMRSAMGKARGLVLRLSLVLEYLYWCAEDGFAAPPETIPESTLLAAAKFVAEYVMPMAERTYGDAACTTADRDTATLARWIARERPTEIHVRHMQRKVRLPGLTTASAIHAACAALIEAGWLGQPAGGGFRQKPQGVYPVSPRLREVLS